LLRKERSVETISTFIPFAAAGKSSIASCAAAIEPGPPTSVQRLDIVGDDADPDDTVGVLRECRTARESRRYHRKIP
jgi:hypothetical protein